MLSKFIYKALMVFAFAFIAQVGYSQNYVGSDEAQLLLKQEIVQFESNLNGKDATSVANAIVSVSSLEVQLGIMQYVLKSVSMQSRTVLQVMTSSYERANNMTDQRLKVERLNALDAIKDLLS